MIFGGMPQVIMPQVIMPQVIMPQVIMPQVIMPQVIRSPFIRFLGSAHAEPKVSLHHVRKNTPAIASTMIVIEDLPKRVGFSFAQARDFEMRVELYAHGTDDITVSGKSCVST